MKYKQEYTLGTVAKIVREAKKQEGGGEAVVEMPWTAEEWLGELKRRGKIKHFAEIKESISEGNIREYRITF